MTLVGAQPKILGILNVTPDSFSDGGRFSNPNQAIAQFDQLLEDGADYVDVGAESTRPGAMSISENEEWVRLMPVLDYASKTGQLDRVSVDTRKFGIMKLAVEMGVSLLNHIGPLPELPELTSLFEQKPNLSFLACHIHGSPETMQDSPLRAKSALKRVRAFFQSTEAELIAAGCRPENIYFDPGIGFGKADSANIALLLELKNLSREFKIALGVSRKGFISRLLGNLSLDSRDAASKMIEAFSILGGAKMIRTHNVKPLRSILAAIGATLAEVAT